MGFLSFRASPRLFLHGRQNLPVTLNQVGAKDLAQNSESQPI